MHISFLLQLSLLSGTTDNNYQSEGVGLGPGSSSGLGTGSGSKFSHFLKFMPSILMDRAVSSKFNVQTTKPQLEDTCRSMDIATGEISFHLIQLLRNLSNTRAWSLAISNVSASILKKGKDMIYSERSILGGRYRCLYI